MVDMSAAEITFNKGNNENSINSTRSRELLNIAVEIGDGQVANILIREFDDPHLIA